MLNFFFFVHQNVMYLCLIQFIEKIEWHHVNITLDKNWILKMSKAIIRKLYEQCIVYLK